MNQEKYIGMDVHQATLSVAVMDAQGKLIMECLLETKAATVVEFIRGLHGTLSLTFEEGTSAAWLHDLLKPLVSRLVVCDPRKNALLKDGNKSDRIDARKLAELLRGNQLHPVYHGEHGVRTLRHLKNLLCLILDDALRLKFIDAAKGNPARLIKIPRVTRIQEPEGDEIPADETYAYTLWEVEMMLTVLPEPAATVCAVAAFAGLRRSELRGVRWVDYNGEQINVMRSVWEGFPPNEPKTMGSKAPVPVIPRLKAILAAHKLACGNPKAGPMFANGKGKPANLNNVLNREILPALNRCGICRKSKTEHDGSHEYVRDGSLPVWHGWHGFRRGLASTLYGLGVDDVMVQQILRHQDVSVTRKHYIKTVPEQSVAAMAKLEAATVALCADRALTTALA